MIFIPFFNVYTKKKNFNHINNFHLNIKFPLEVENNGNLAFVDILLRQNNKKSFVWIALFFSLLSFQATFLMPRAIVKLLANMFRLPIYTYLFTALSPEKL